MKRKFIVGVAAAGLALAALLVWSLTHQRPPLPVRRGISHQLPYKWDSYVRPDLQFSMEPMSNVIARVNAAIREISTNAVPEAIKLDTTPARIVKVDSNAALDPYMDKLISDFRENEREMNRRGAQGFEGTPFSDTLDGHHSLWCTLVGPGNGGLHWETKEDALHAARMPRMIECRPYGIAKGLEDLMEKNRNANSLHVDCEPIVSALIDATGIHFWSMMIPDGPNAWTSESRFDKVFKYVPDMKVILAITTPEEHVKAEKKLKASGRWIEPGTKESGHNQVSDEEPAPSAASSSPQR